MREKSSEVFEVRPIGRVSSSLTDPSVAPKQGPEDAPDARIVLDPGVIAGLDGIRAGDEVIVLTWMHLADRDVLTWNVAGLSDHSALWARLAR